MQSINLKKPLIWLKISSVKNLVELSSKEADTKERKFNFWYQNLEYYMDLIEDRSIFSYTRVRMGK